MRAKHCGNSAKTWLGTLDTGDTRTKTNCEANGEDDGLLQRYYPPRRITPPPPSCRFKIIIAFLVDCTATILFALKDSNSHYMRENDILYHFSHARSELGGISLVLPDLCALVALATCSRTYVSVSVARQRSSVAKTTENKHKANTKRRPSA